MDRTLLIPFSIPTVKVSKVSVRKTFTREEDAKLVEIVNSMSENFEGWTAVAKQMGTRSARQCRERWYSYLSPDIRVEKWTPEEDQFLLRLVEQYGTKWCKIAAHFNGRSNSDIKNRWYFHLRVIATFNHEGKIVIDPENQTKKKRCRKVVCAYEEAIKTLNMQKSKSEITQTASDSNPQRPNTNSISRNSPNQLSNNSSPIIEFTLEHLNACFNQNPQSASLNNFQLDKIHQVPNFLNALPYPTKSRILFPPIHQLIEENGLQKTAF